MNIFVLDEDPVKAAMAMCDKHVPKMVLESAQLLCSVYYMTVKTHEDVPYRLTHKNHPCSIWCRESQANFNWLCNHAMSLCDEFNFRFGKTHASKSVIDWCRTNIHRIPFNLMEPSKFALAMPDQYKKETAAASYRSYYKNEKKKFAKWERGRSAPEWWNSD